MPFRQMYMPPFLRPFLIDRFSWAVKEGGAKLKQKDLINCGLMSDVFFLSGPFKFLNTQIQVILRSKHFWQGEGWNK